MDQNTPNAENLHKLGGKDKIFTTTNQFVSPGTPEAPLVTAKDLQNSEVSPEASQKLRDGLVK